MVAKTPDYIIADCGRPQWNTNRKEIDFDTLKHFAISMDKNKRLLPLRETITDYYVQALADKFNAWKTLVASAKQRETLYQLNKRYDDPSIVKHMKTQRNEATRRQQQSHYSHTNSKPHISDKRRRSRTPATTTTTTIAVTENTTLDSDLDVF